ncbi:MAG: hypothetical protein EBT92_15870 [Planctomycetes bacterium]|nr:hypothetical protein [Planctomycetota bacterium]
MPSKDKNSWLIVLPFFRTLPNGLRQQWGPITFASAVFIILLWALTGSFFKFSDTWQLVINTGTNLVTFLVAFLVLNTQNCDSASLQLKLDELIRSMNGVHNSFLDIENMSENISGRSRCASKWLPKLPENTCMVA